MLQDAVGDERAELLVVGIEQLVVDDFGEDAVIDGEGSASPPPSVASKAPRPKPPPAPTAQGDLF